MTLRSTLVSLAALAALAATAGLAGAPAGAQDGPATTTTSTPDRATTTGLPTTITLPSETRPTPAEPPLGPVEPLDLRYDPAAGTIAITNPCGVGGDDEDQQVTYDLFLIAASGTRVQLAAKQSPYATVPAHQTASYTIPASLPYGSVEVLLQCSALPITIVQPRQQFSATIDWQGLGTAAAPESPVPAEPVPGDPSFTG